MKYDIITRKWQILGVMYQYGCDPDVLKSHLPHIEIQQIRSIVKSFKERALKRTIESRTLNKCDDAAIDLWYDYIKNCHTIEGTSNIKKKKLLKKTKKISIPSPPSNDYSFLLSKSMMYAAYFEDHYKSNNPDEPNYNEIYRYLSQILAGKEPTQLRPGNAAKVMEMIGRVKEIINDKDSVQRYLTYMKDNHKVSYLKSKNPSEVADEKRETLPLKVAEEFEKYQDFKNDFHVTDTELENINQSDSRFIYKRENSILKLSLKQRACASAIASIPGMNPLEVVPQSLVKPADAIIPTRKTRKRGHPSTEDKAS